jgi:DHA2 family multidrug resistance protein
LRWVAAGGTFIAGLATWLQTGIMTTHTSFGALVATQMLSGVGYAFIFVPLNVMLFKTVPPAEIPSALALTRLSQQIGASVGSAVAATLLDRGYALALSTLAGPVSLSNPTIAAFVAAHGGYAVGMLGALAAAEAQNISAVNATAFFALLTMAAAVLPFALKRHREPPIPAVVPAVAPLKIEVVREDVAPRELSLR